MAPFSYLQKFFRACYHLEQLAHDIQQWYDDGNYTQWIAQDKDDPEQYILYATASEVPAGPYSVLLGDAVQNFRSSLDHLVFELALRVTNPMTEDVARALQFPIVGDTNSGGQAGQGTTLFNNQRRCIAAIDPQAQAVVEALQPFHSAQTFEQHPLWKLQQLSNVDKHRALHLATVYGGGFGIDTLRFRNADVRRVEIHGNYVTKDATVVARLLVRKPDPTQSVYVELEPNPAIAFIDPPLANQDVLRTLVEIQAFLYNEVFPKLSPFL